MIFLPELRGDMPIAEAILIEVLHILVEEGVITEGKAASRYRKHRKRNIAWKGEIPREE